MLLNHLMDQKNVELEECKRNINQLISENELLQTINDDHQLLTEKLYE